MVAIAVPVILYQGRDQWFYLDEWDFLANRSAGSFHDLMAPHVQHWTTFGILVYRALWWLVGINHYWPYQLCVVTLHLAAAVLLRTVMRRAGVNPWIATAAASLFALFGAGRQDIVFAFQITFTGALTFGLAHILLADHDGPFDRRDLIGIGFGAAGADVLGASASRWPSPSGSPCSCGVVGGWPSPTLRRWPPHSCSGRPRSDETRTAGRRPRLGSVMTFVREAFVSVFDGFGQVPGAGVLLAVVVVVGVPLALTPADMGRVPAIRRSHCGARPGRGQLRGHHRLRTSAGFGARSRAGIGDAVCPCASRPCCYRPSRSRCPRSSTVGGSHYLPPSPCFSSAYLPTWPRFIPVATSLRP